MNRFQPNFYLSNTDPPLSFKHLQNVFFIQNIVLISRTPFKLQNVSADIESKFKVRTKILDVDFANHSSKDYVPRIEGIIKDISVGVLVNNVGMSYDHPEAFLGTTTDLVRLNFQLISMNFYFFIFSICC